MKNTKKLILTFAAAVTLSFSAFNTTKIHAATKDDVIAAARAAGIPDVYVQAGINYLDSVIFTSEQYDQIIGSLSGYADMSSEAIDSYLKDAGIDVGAAAPETEKSAETEKPSEVVPNEVDNVITEYAAMTPEQQKEYLAGMTVAEKNQILKNLDKSKQLEIINSLIDATSELGMNVTVDGLTKDALEYSVRDNNGDIIDISSVGVIIDDTGIDYTALIITALAVLVLSVSGIAAFAVMQKRTPAAESDERKF